jgi:hypothetical protein
MSAVAVDLDDHVRKQIVIMSLMDFYREFDPRQIPMVESTFYENSKDITGLFDKLLRRYPRAARDRFDDVLSTLRGLDSSSQQQRETMTAQSTMRSKRAQVQELLSQGAALLAAPVPAEFAAGFDRESHDDDDTQSRASGVSESAYGGYGASTQAPSFIGRGSDTGSDLGDASGAHRDDLQMLKQLIEDNRKLADEVAIAEQQVLQKRFEVKYLKTVGTTLSEDSGGSQSEINKNSERSTAAMLMIIADRDRIFEIPCTHAEVTYIRQGPLDAPWSLDDSEHCQVQFQLLEGLSSRKKLGGALAGGAVGSREDNVTPDTSEPPSKVMRTILAIAMRVWSRRRSHTVTERLATGDVLTHTSSILWWQWPTPCEGQRGVAPESLLNPGSFADGFDRALLRVDEEIRAPLAAERRVTPLHDEVCHLLTSTPSQRQRGGTLRDGGDDDDASPTRQETFWKYFVHQYGALSRAAPAPLVGGGGAAL